MRRNTFEKLFLYYAKGLMVYAREFVGTDENAEDIVHDVFVSFWKVMDHLSDDNIKAYLFRATRNKCINYLSRKKIRSDYNEQVIKKGCEPDFNLYIESEIEQIINDAVNQLSPQCKKIFLMSRQQGKTSAQIAEELNISPRTVEKHIEIALKSLKNALSGY